MYSAHYRLWDDALYKFTTDSDINISISCDLNPYGLVHCSLKCSLLFGHSSLIGFNQFLSETIHTRVKNVIWHYGFLRRLDKLHRVNQQSFAIRWRHWRRWFITLQRRCRPWSTVNWWQTRQLLVYVRSWHDGESLSTLEVTNVSLRICLSKQFLSYTRSKACSCKASSSIHQ